MGQLNCARCHNGKLKLTDGEEGCARMCLPDFKYRRFPGKMKKPPFSLLIEKSVFPVQAYEHKVEHQQCGSDAISNNRFWNVDAQFVPNDDTILFVTGELFEPKILSRRELAKPVQATGSVVKLKLDEDSCEEVFPKARVAAYPKLSMHPSGSYIGLADDRKIKIQAVDGDEVFVNDLSDPNGRCLTECLSLAFAPNGKQVARIQLRYNDDKRVTSLGFYIDKFELVVSELDNGYLSCSKVMNLDEKLPRFYSGTMQDRMDYIEHMVCKWSPDSKYIVVSSPRCLCMLNQNFRLYVNIVSEILRFEMFQTYGFEFDFEPRSHHKFLAVGAHDNSCGRVYFINSKSKKVLGRSEELGSEIKCLQYHPFGKYVAVGTQMYNIFLVEPCNGIVRHHIDLCSLCRDLTPGGFTRLSFTSTGEQLVTATTDGKVRVFQMPAELSLFNLCKWTILTLVPQTKLGHLTLPKKVLSKLIGSSQRKLR